MRVIPGSVAGTSRRQFDAVAGKPGRFQVKPDAQEGVSLNFGARMGLGQALGLALLAAVTAGASQPADVLAQPARGYDIEADWANRMYGPVLKPLAEHIRPIIDGIKIELAKVDPSKLDEAKRQLHEANMAKVDRWERQLSGPEPEKGASAILRETCLAMKDPKGRPVATEFKQEDVFARIIKRDANKRIIPADTVADWVLLSTCQIKGTPQGMPPQGAQWFSPIPPHLLGQPT